MSLFLKGNFCRFAALWIAALLALPAAKAREFRVADTQSEDYPTVQALTYMARIVEERTAGRHRIRVFHSRQLGEEKDTIEQTRVGAIDLNRTNVAPIGSLIPTANVLALPFLFRSFDHLHNVLDRAIGDEVLAGFQQHGFVGLAFYDSGARSIYGKKPVKTLADAKGMKIRVQQSDLWVALVGAMGANPTPMPIGEVYTGLKTGLIDAAENNIPSYDGFKHYEAVKFYSKTEHSMAPEMLLMSKVVYDKLSPAEQQMIRKAAKDSVAFQRKKWDEEEIKSLEVVKKGGAQIVDVDKASFQAVMAPVYDKFMNTPDLKRMVKAVQDTK